MKRRTKVNGWIAAVAAVSVLAAGCGVRTDTPVESGATAPVETTAVQTEPGTVEKPTHPEPSVIEPFPTEEPQTEADELHNGNRIVLMTDMHYLASSLTDGGEAFQTMIDHGDG